MNRSCRRLNHHSHENMRYDMTTCKVTLRENQLLEELTRWDCSEDFYSFRLSTG